MAVKATSSMAIMQSKAWMRMFLRLLTLWFSRLRCCLSLEMAPSAEALKAYSLFNLSGP
jgi:hypothetical protein